MLWVLKYSFGLHLQIQLYKYNNFGLQVFPILTGLLTGLHTRRSTSSTGAETSRRTRHGSSASLKTRSAVGAEMGEVEVRRRVDTTEGIRGAVDLESSDMFCRMF